MNNKQKLSIWLGVTLLIGMMCVPPWRYSVRQHKAGDTSQDAGYHIISSEPHIVVHSGLLTNIYIDITKLSIQGLAVLILTGGLLVTNQTKKQQRLKQATRKHTSIKQLMIQLNQAEQLLNALMSYIKLEQIQFQLIVLMQYFLKILLLNFYQMLQIDRIILKNFMLQTASHPLQIK